MQRGAMGGERIDTVSETVLQKGPVFSQSGGLLWRLPQALLLNIFYYCSREDLAAVLLALRSNRALHHAFLCSMSMERFLVQGIKARLLLDFSRWISSGIERPLFPKVPFGVHAYFMLADLEDFESTQQHYRKIGKAFRVERVVPKQPCERDAQKLMASLRAWTTRDPMRLKKILPKVFPSSFWVRSAEHAQEILEKYELILCRFKWWNGGTRTNLSTWVKDLTKFIDFEPQPYVLYLDKEAFLAADASKAMLLLHRAKNLFDLLGGDERAPSFFDKIPKWFDDFEKRFEETFFRAYGSHWSYAGQNLARTNHLKAFLDAPDAASAMDIVRVSSDVSIFLSFGSTDCSIGHVPSWFSDFEKHHRDLYFYSGKMLRQTHAVQSFFDAPDLQEAIRLAQCAVDLSSLLDEGFKKRDRPFLEPSSPSNGKSAASPLQGFVPGQLPLWISEFRKKYSDLWTDLGRKLKHARLFKMFLQAKSLEAAHSIATQAQCMVELIGMRGSPRFLAKKLKWITLFKEQHPQVWPNLSAILSQATALKDFLNAPTLMAAVEIAKQAYTNQKKPWPNPPKIMIPTPLVQEPPQNEHLQMGPPPETSVTHENVSHERDLPPECPTEAQASDLQGSSAEPQKTTVSVLPIAPKVAQDSELSEPPKAQCIPPSSPCPLEHSPWKAHALRLWGALSSGAASFVVYRWVSGIYWLPFALLSMTLVVTLIAERFQTQHQDSRIGPGRVNPSW